MGRFKAILRDESRLILICQNEEKLNGAYRLVMHKFLHDSLSRGTMCIINADLWSGKKAIVHATISEVNVTSFTNTGRTCLKRAILECERRFF